MSDIGHHAPESTRDTMTDGANRLTPRATDASLTTEPVENLRVMADALSRLGFDVITMLARSGLRRHDLDDPDARVPCAALQQLLGAAYAERARPNLAAHMASVVPIGAFPLLDYLIVTADTVGGALEQLERYFSLVTAPCTLKVVVEEESTRLLVNAADNPFIAQFQTSIAVHHLREETNGALRVSHVSLVDPPDDLRDLERLLGCAVHAPAAWNGVEFPRAATRLPLRRRDPVLRRVLEGHAASVAPRQSRSPESIVEAVRSVVVTRLARGLPDVDAVARHLAIAPRTLQRRLAAKGVSYQQVVDDVRRDAAERLLADPSLAVSQIGYLLGFSEPSAFHRAFKRWHDLTPQEYRQTTQRSVAR